ncbi:hypothetical protein Tsp_08214 [Trichinella spiralis]|uniref:hypothetical protein n=1 Tax=Trichinella spiralis TaxID=6334 RepID=UPI0001EFEA4E|nr:hypothetical protein Tsp_08214 [Trichinella spiralis]
MALFSSTSRDPHTAARLEKNEKEKTGEKATTASGAADKKLFANFPAVGNVSLVGERTIQPVGKRNRKTQSYKSERLDTGFTTANKDTPPPPPKTTTTTTRKQASSEEPTYSTPPMAPTRNWGVEGGGEKSRQTQTG